MKKFTVLFVLSLLFSCFATNVFAGDGTKDNPYTVAEALEVIQEGVWVRGYIVGYSNGANPTTINLGTPDPITGSDIWIVLGESAESPASLLPVGLSTGGTRENLNLKTNPSMLGKEVSLFGNLRNANGKGLFATNDYVLHGAGSTDATLSDIKVDNVSIDEFSASTRNYIVNLPYGTTVVPTVTATANDENATPVITHAEKLPGKTTITVTAEDPGFISTYTIEFRVGTGTLDDPYSIAQAQLLQGIATAEIWIRGFIVGTPASASVLEPVNLNGPFTLNNFILLADDAEEESVANLLPLSMSIPTATRNAVNLADHPENLGEEILIKCVIDVYAILGTVGVKSPADYVFLNPAKSEDATLSSIKIDNMEIADFSPEKLNYIHYLDDNTVPAIEVVTNHDAADKTITPPASIPGTATILVTAGDGKTNRTYTVYLTDIEPGDGSETKPYTVEEARLFQGTNDVWVKGYIVGGLALSGINSPLFEGPFTRNSEILIATSASENDVQNVLIVRLADDTPAQKRLNLKDYAANLGKEVLIKGDLKQVYSSAPGINPVTDFKIAASADATLSDIKVDDVSIEDFDSQEETYNIVLPYGTTDIPEVKAISTHNFANTAVTQATALPGAATIVVTAEDGETNKTYTVNFTIADAPSTDATLSDIKVNNVSIEGFESSKETYTVELEAGTTDIPTVTATPTDENAEAAVTQATDLPGAATIVVTAEDGETTKTYTVNFTIADAPSTDATLSDIKVNNVSIEGFESSKETYTVELEAGTTDIPTVTATPTDENAEAAVTQATDLPGAATIVVTAEDGETTKTYTVNFTVKEPVGLNSSLADNMIIYSTVGKLHILSETDATIEIYSMLGNKLASINAVDGLNSIDLQSGQLVVVKINDKASKVIIK